MIILLRRRPPRFASSSPACCRRSLSTVEEVVSQLRVGDHAQTDERAVVPDDASKHANNDGDGRPAAGSPPAPHDRTTARREAFLSHFLPPQVRTAAVANQQCGRCPAPTLVGGVVASSLPAGFRRVSSFSILRRAVSRRDAAPLTAARRQKNKLRKEVEFIPRELVCYNGI